MLARVSSVTKGRLFHCDQCDRTFSRKDNLNRHLVLHTGNFKWYFDIREKGYNTTQKKIIIIILEHRKV